jgi:hypothetical protein
MGDGKVIDMMVAALHDPFHNIHMGVTAENVAAKWGITRQMQDELAVESHRRAAAATRAGHFKSQILPITIKGRKGDTVFDTDEHFRDGVNDGGHGQAQAGVREGERHRDRRQRLRHQRRRRRRGADGARGAEANAASSRWRGWSATGTPASIRSTWASARCRRPPTR